MLDALGFAGECAQQLAHQAVHERGPAGVHLRRDVAVDRGHGRQVGAGRVQVVRNRHEPREDRLLALLERGERPRHEQEQAGERGLRVHRGVVRVPLDLLEVGAHRCHFRAHHRVVHALIDRQVLPRHGRDQPLVEVAQPGPALADAVGRVVRQQRVVVVDAGHRRGHGIVAQRDLDELLAQCPELPHVLDRRAPVATEGPRAVRAGA